LGYFHQLYFKPSDKAVILSEAPHRFIAYVFLQKSHKIVILRACDLLDLSCMPHIQLGVCRLPNKNVILSEALRRSIANRSLYGAEPKDLGDACWQMLLGAFRPQTATEDKKFTNSERSASSIYRVTQRLMARSRRMTIL
jgi:hypothetical protein